MGKAQIGEDSLDNPSTSVDSPAVWDLSDEHIIHSTNAYFSPAPDTILGPGHKVMSNRDLGCELFILID